MFVFSILIAYVGQVDIGLVFVAGDRSRFLGFEVAVLIQINARDDFDAQRLEARCADVLVLVGPVEDLNRPGGDGTQFIGSEAREVIRHLGHGFCDSLGCFSDSSEHVQVLAFRIRVFLKPLRHLIEDLNCILLRPYGFN